MVAVVRENFAGDEMIKLKKEFSEAEKNNVLEVAESNPAAGTFFLEIGYAGNHLTDLQVKEAGEAILAALNEAEYRPALLNEGIQTEGRSLYAKSLMHFENTPESHMYLVCDALNDEILNTNETLGVIVRDTLSELFFCKDWEGGFCYHTAVNAHKPTLTERAASVIRKLGF